MKIFNFRFVPSVSAIIYHGSKKERMDLRRKFMPKAIGPKFPLIVTSYEVALNDARVLALYKWKYVVVDEVMLKLNYCSFFSFSSYQCFLYIVFDHLFFFPFTGPSIEKFKVHIIKGIETPAN